MSHVSPFSGQKEAEALRRGREWDRHGQHGRRSAARGCSGCPWVGDKIWANYGPKKGCSLRFWDEMSRSSTNENYRNNDWIIYPLVCRLHTSLMLAGYFAIDHPCWLGQWDRDITDASWWFILSVLVVWVCRKLGYTLFEGYFHANISWWIPKKEWGTLYSDKAICCHRKKRLMPAKIQLVWLSQSLQACRIYPWWQAMGIEREQCSLPVQVGRGAKCSRVMSHMTPMACEEYGYITSRKEVINLGCPINWPWIQPNADVEQCWVDTTTNFLNIYIYNQLVGIAWCFFIV